MVSSILFGCVKTYALISKVDNTNQNIKKYFFDIGINQRDPLRAKSISYESNLNKFVKNSISL